MISNILITIAMLFAFVAWRVPTDSVIVEGDASYYDPGLMEVVAANRGYSLDGYLGGVSMMRRGDLEREVWVEVNGEWVGPFLVVDCAAENHFADLARRGRVIEFSREQWLEWGWPEDLVPVKVRFGSR